MTAKEYFEYDQDTIPFEECSTRDAEEYDYDGDEPPYSKYKMIAFAEGYHKKQLALHGVLRSLLKKYMIHVENCEGVNFVSDIDRPWCEVEFTKEEIDYLQKLDKEINESNEC